MLWHNGKIERSHRSDQERFYNYLRFYSYEEKSLERWRKPTFADCTAFGGIATRILNEYKPKDEIWLIAKYYSKQQNGKYYKGFIVREIITEQEIQQASESVFDDLPF